MYLKCFVPFGLYIILKGGGTRFRVPPRLLTLLWLRGQRQALYRVPVCQAGGYLQNSLAHLFVAHCRTRMQHTRSVVLQDSLAHLCVAHCRMRMQNTCDLLLPDSLAHMVVAHYRTRMLQTCDFTADGFLAHLFVSHCPLQAETKCSGKLGGDCAIERPVSA